jgi:hypothetical protein
LIAELASSFSVRIESFLYREVLFLVEL